MKRDKFSGQNLALYGAGAVLVSGLGLILAPYLRDGLPGLLRNAGEISFDPRRISLCESSLKTVLLLLLAYGLALGVYLSSEKNYRRREEHGSARWGRTEEIAKRYADKAPLNSKQLTQHVAVSLDTRKHQRNLNVMVVGGSGAGKTRYYCKPNLLNCNCSYVVLDPNGYNLGG